MKNLFLDRFSLADFRECESRLSRLATSIQSSERITGTLLDAIPIIRLGDMLYSRDFDLFTTDNQSVLARAHLPYTGGVAWFEGYDGLAHQMAAVVGLGRLQGIKQLSLLAHPVSQGELQMAMAFNHDRFIHTYDVYAIGMICAHNIGVHGADLMALRLSLIVHDLFTPACGDLMKFVDRKAYDEDELLSTLLGNQKWLSMCKELFIDPAEPIRIAQEKDGILCAIRDFADTLAYVARDLYMFKGQYRTRESWYEEIEDQRLERELQAVSGDPTAFTLWEHVRRGKNGNIVVDSHKKLQNFLFARACLFKLLYYHRQTRNVEYILGIRLVKFLLKRGDMASEEFFGQWGQDDVVWRKVEELTGFNLNFLNSGARGTTHLFDTFEQAVRFTGAECAHDPDVCGLIYQWPSATKTKVNSWFVVKDGVEIPWGDAYPVEAKRIQDIMTLHKGWHVSIVRRGGLIRLKGDWWQLLREASLDAV